MQTATDHELKNPSLSSVPKDMSLQQVKVNNRGDSINSSGEMQKVPTVVFEFIVDMRILAKAVVKDAETGDV